MQVNKIEPQVITIRQAERAYTLPVWLKAIGNMAFWLSVALFLKAFADAV